MSRPSGAGLFAARTGDGPRPVVVLHGFLGSGRNLSTLARQLAAADARLSVFAVDLRGHGASPPLAHDTDLTALARDVLDTADELTGAAPLAIVGHSLGGRVGLAACVLAPSRIAHVTLLDVSPSPLPRSSPPPASPRGAAETTAVVEALLRAPDTAPGRDVFRAHFRAAGLSGELTEWLLMNLVHEQDAYRWRIDRDALAAWHRRTGGEDLWPAVEGEHAYTMHCVRGGASAYVDEADALRLTAAGCPVDTVDGAGHFLHAERPAEILALVQARLGPALSVER